MTGYQFMEGVYVYFVTFTIKDWLPVFQDPKAIQIISESLRFCILEKCLRIHAYVIMKEHIHLIVFDANFDNLRLQKTLGSFRKFTGKKLADYLDENYANSLPSAIRSQIINDRARQVWQRGWHVESLASEKFLQQKVNYVHENPVRKGFVQLPEDWDYSSAGYWVNGREGSTPVVLVVEEED